ncbi:uncharacterized protein PV06_00302 [Exophiala oligosperma]|uniref:Uncharacterized protein n=2 Tax=Chaetothyriales TaxID=34395 RepID=A0A0D2DX04_9EURO|nr:uncharacterized protein PV06_00302 [Exophiala oligosperma]KAJ9647591.1 hypothetical protein H2204_000221 [Knufia peltigerae]KIW47623.1 hypothetical protein PV06_00302 [Exophiala oligosperma]
MSFFSSNRFVAIILILGLGTICYSVPGVLQQVKDAARAPEPDPPPPRKRLQKDSENSLKIDTLRTLADGYSYELRSSALKIVNSRTVHSRAKDLLLRDLASKDYERRDKAINALLLLLKQQHAHSRRGSLLAEFDLAKRLKATVQALINVLPLHETPGQQPEQKSGGLLPQSPILPPSRPAQEESLLVVLNYMLAEESSGNVMDEPPIYSALNAGLVTKWLVKYPFPCALPENQGYNFKRSDVARLFERSAWKSDDHLMAGIIFQVVHHPRGRKQMREAGLQASSYRENLVNDGWNNSYLTERWDQDDSSDDDDDDRDVVMVGGEDTAGQVRDDVTDWDGIVPPPISAAARQRSVERSQEEEHLRRRHREAIVVAERGTPLSRENILQRADSRDLRPMNGVSEVEVDLNGLLGLSGDDQDDSSSPQQSPTTESNGSHSNEGSIHDSTTDTDNTHSEDGSDTSPEQEFES